MTLRPAHLKTDVPLEIGGATPDSATLPAVKAPPEKIVERIRPERAPPLTERLPVTGGGELSAFDLRLGKRGLARLWDSVQWIAGAGDPGALKDAQGRVGKVNALAPSLVSLDDRDLLGKSKALRESVEAETAGLRTQLSELRAAAERADHADDPRAPVLARRARVTQNKLQEIEKSALAAVLPASYALTAEACARKLGMRPYDEQVLAASLLSEGKIVEQYTGEGKTLSTVLHAAQSALTGRGVHVATASNYLAKRDAIEMAPVYHAVGLTVAALTPDGAVKVTPEGEVIEVSRRMAYEADILYATATELGFDHLRDQLATSPDARVQREHATLVMDEVDSLLIDDARTPLIISGEAAAPDADAWRAISREVQLLPEPLIEFDRPEGWAVLSEAGLDALLNRLGVAAQDYASDPELQRMIYSAVYARELLVRDIDYQLKGGKIELIGRNGEVMEGRRFTGGLHQAIESREGVEIQPENISLNMITLRQYLALYERGSGLTGTAESSEPLFREIYGFDVVRIPTHRRFQRTDEPTRLFATIADKAAALLKDAAQAAAAGRPVLIGTRDERSAAWLSEYFARAGVAHHVLTAKNEEQEAQVIGEGGRPGTITITTPKGGRGVHFALGGKLSTVTGELIAQGMTPTSAREEAKRRVEADRERIIQQGGLMVLGFEHHDSQRRDDQLRGRAARQGDPGTTRFYASLQDSFFMNAELPRWLSETPPPPEGLTGDRVQALIRDHLKRGEGKTEGSIRRSLPFDELIGNHRERFFDQRARVLDAPDLRAQVADMIADEIKRVVAEALSVRGPRRGKALGDRERLAVYQALRDIVPLAERDTAPASWRSLSESALVEKITEQLSAELDRLLTRLGEGGLKAFVVASIGEGFAEHVEGLTTLRDNIHLETPPGKEPQQVFAERAGEAWQGLMAGSRRVIAESLLGELPPMALR
ncbi:MAG: hypothetical protein IT384_31620 [Deltaproteobacteria bacterium]|nr:hypothetical protein [Deltaproteobacteria bacterium]